MSSLKTPPKAVAIAVAVAKLLLIFVFANGLLSIIHAKDYRSLSTLNIGNGVYMTLLVFGIYILWVLINFIKKGWNVGRFLFLFLYIINLVDWFIEFYGKPNLYLHAVFFLGCVEIVLGLISVVLLFSPSGSAWFKQKSTNS